MKQCLILFFLTFIFAQWNFAQKIDTPQKVDEFGTVNSEELTVRIEQLRFELDKNPSAKGYVVIYRDNNLPYGYPIRLGIQIKNFLIHILGTSSDRFEIVNGGLLDARKTELWIIPNQNESLFSPFQDRAIDSKQSVMFDSIPYPSLYDDRGCCAISGYTKQAKKASITEFARQLQRNPHSDAYIILYGQFCTDCSSSAIWSKSGKYLGLKPDVYFDSNATIWKVLNKERRHIANLSNINPSRIKIINGGYRKWREMELWIVPKNGVIPKLKPKAFPTQKTYRNTTKIYNP